MYGQRHRRPLGVALLMTTPSQPHVECLPLKQRSSMGTFFSKVHCWVFEENLVKFLQFAMTFETPLIAEEFANGIRLTPRWKPMR